MRTLHRPLWEAMLDSLISIFHDGRMADKVIQFQLKQNRKWGSQDRRLFAEGLYDVVRWWRRLSLCAEIDWPGVERGDLARVLEAWCLLHEVEPGRGIERQMKDASAVREIWNDKGLERAVRESIPDWLDEWGESQLGERWDQLLPVLNSSAPVYLRANRLKTTPAELVKRLGLENVQAEVCGVDGLRLKKRANVFLTDSFKQGLFEVQDLNSQKIASQLEVEPGLRVIDACAGAGGKSLHLAALMKNKGRIVAMDVQSKKLEQLRLRSTRAGASLIEVREIENRKAIKRLAASADRMLLDVPCSGLGVLRRNPDSKWRLSSQEVERVGLLQREILRDYVSMVKPGGLVVYATCSIMPGENSRVVAEFLSQSGTGFQKVREETLWPEPDGPDGFYYCQLRRSALTELRQPSNLNLQQPVFPES